MKYIVVQFENATDLSSLANGTSVTVGPVTGGLVVGQAAFEPTLVEHTHEVIGVTGTPVTPNAKE